MKTMKLAMAGAVLFAALASQAAVARELGRLQITQFAATDRAPKTRTECIGRVKGKAPDGKEWQACTEWRTQAQIYFRRTHIVLNGAEKLERAQRKIAEDCLKRASSAAQSASATSGSAAALPTAETTFEKCATERELLNPSQFNLTIEESADWTGWR